jgi:hypothetical protein
MAYGDSPMQYPLATVPLPSITDGTHGVST